MESIEDVVSRLNNDVVSKFNGEASAEQEKNDTTESSSLTLNEKKIVSNEGEDPNIVSLSESSTVVDEYDFDEKKVLGYLSKKLGKEYGSLEDLNQTQTSEDRPEILVQMEKWMKETGYDDINVYLKTQATDYESMDTKSLIINDYMVSKGLNAEQAELYYDKNFGRESIDEDYMEEKEIHKIQKLNKTKEIEESLAANEAKVRFQQMKEKYAMPSQVKSQSNKISEVQEQMKSAWESNAKQTIDSLKEIVLPITKEKGYKYSFSDYIAKNQETLSSPDKFFQRFLNENGTWDMTKLMKAAAITENIESLASSLYGQGLSDGQKTVVTSGKNLNFDKTQRSNDNGQSKLDDRAKKSLNDVLSRLNPSVYNL